jgi:hypothetical protein
MEATIISTQVLPLPIRERIRATRVSIADCDGGVLLLPVEASKGRPTNLFGMLAGSGLSSEEFAYRKQSEKEME